MRKYWPENDDEGLIFGPLCVDLTAQQDDQDSIMTRDLRVTHADGVSVSHFI